MYYNKLNKWNIIAAAENIAENETVCEIADELSLTHPTAQVLVNRGCKTPEDAKRFIGKKEEQLYDPFLMKDMKLAADRICDAVTNGENIVIYGDYDVDGVTSVSTLYLYLESLGASVSYYIPCRASDGYGVSSGAIEKLASQNCNLIITVDTGITAIEEIQMAKNLGIDVVITDHHECHSDLPNAVAVVNPKREDCEYPFKELAGVGVVFKVICAIESTLNPSDSLAVCVRRIAQEYCDLIAIGTIADVMPVKDENRLIISYGLSLLENTQRPALIELINASSSDGKNSAQKKITAGFIGYTLAPRINAAGRISDASIAVEMFLSKDSETAKKYAKKLCDTNHERQRLENLIIESAYAKIAAFHDFENEPVLVLDDDSWHQGIIGIVASRITEKYGCSSILISFEGESRDGKQSPDDTGKGSGRSVKGVNLVEALSSCSDLLEKYGGHELAAGLTISRKNLDKFKKRINEYVKNCMQNDNGTVTIEADAELVPSDITMKLASELYYLEPYGVSNPIPVFMMTNLYVKDAVSVGGGKHTKLVLKKENMIITAMCFRRSLSDLDLYPGDTADVLFNLDINEFQGMRNLQMIVRDIRLSAEQLKCEIREHHIIDSILCGKNIEMTEKEIMCVLPSRTDFAAVYNTLKKELRVEHEVFSIRALGHLLKSYGYVIPYIKLKLIVMIFRELNLIGVDETDAEKEIYSFKYIYVRNKTSLDKSNIYKKLKSEFRANK